MRLIYLSIVLFFLTQTRVSSQEVPLSTTPDSVSIGDLVTISMVLPNDWPYRSLILPDSTAFGSSIELRERKQFRTASASDSIVYTLQYYGTEDLLIQGLSLALVNGEEKKVLNLPDVRIPFKSILKEPEPEFRPLKSIYDFAINWIPYIILGLLLLLIAWVLIRYMRRYMAQIPAITQPMNLPEFENPLEVLELKLAYLRSGDQLLKGEFKYFYTQLGDALRAYIETVYHIPAMESTTREVLRDMKLEQIDPTLSRYCEQVLRQADMAKFAKYKPSSDQALEDCSQAEAFLQRARTIDQMRILTMKAEFEQARAANSEANASTIQQAEEKKHELGES
jgi:hypothetical protein